MFSLCSNERKYKEYVPMLPGDLPFRVVRINSEDEVLARATNLIIGRAAFETAVRPKLIAFRFTTTTPNTGLHLR